MFLNYVMKAIRRTKGSSLNHLLLCSGVRYLFYASGGYRVKVKNQRFLLATSLEFLYLTKSFFIF